MNKTRCLPVLAVSALATFTPDAFAQGVKRVVNAGNVSLNVTIHGRAGLDVGTDRGVVSATILPGQSVRLTYGDTANPFINELDASESTRKSLITTAFRSSEGGTAHC